MLNTIIISDTHFPYHHPDTFAFLAAIKKKYKIQIVKHVGDVIDHHTASFHEIEYGTLSPKEEHERCVHYVQILYKMFPKMTISLGNHDNIPARKAKLAGLSPALFRDYNHLYGTKGWKWVNKELFKINKDEECLLVHSMGGNTLTNATKHSFNSVQGHHHSKFGIEYFADCAVLKWSMTVGCLIDPNSEAFKYNASSAGRPIIGCGAIINDMPIAIPMRLNRKGRWIGKL